MSHTFLLDVVMQDMAYFLHVTLEKENFY